MFPRKVVSRITALEIGFLSLAKNKKKEQRKQELRYLKIYVYPKKSQLRSNTLADPEL